MTTHNLFLRIVFLVLALLTTMPVWASEEDQCKDTCERQNRQCEAACSAQFKEYSDQYNTCNTNCFWSDTSCWNKCTQNGDTCSRGAEYQKTQCDKGCKKFQPGTKEEYDCSYNCAVLGAKSANKCNGN